MGASESEAGRERQRQTARQRDRQADRERQRGERVDRSRERVKERKKDKEREREREREREEEREMGEVEEKYNCILSNKNPYRLNSLSNISIKEVVYREKLLSSGQIVPYALYCSDLLSEGHDIRKAAQEYRVTVKTALCTIEYRKVSQGHLQIGGQNRNR